MEFQFDKEKHEYKLDGLVLPSVTQVISDNNLLPYRHADPAVMEANRDFGTKLHKATELLDLGTLDRSSTPDLNPYLDSWEKFKKDWGVEILHVETCGFHSKYGYGFTADRVAKINRLDKICIIDLKSGPLTKATAIQLSAYDQGMIDFMRWPKKMRLGRIGVQLTPKKPIPKPYKDKNDFDVFLACLKITNWKRSQ